MSLTVTEQANLGPLNTLGIAAGADYLVRVTSTDQIPALIELSHQHNLPLIILGGGSNIIIGSAQLRAIVAKIELTGRHADVTPTHTDITIAAGEDWDAFVAWSVEQGLHGIEALSLIPGTVGGVPVQNIGAYGQEASETITAVEAYNLVTGKPATVSPAECRFSYRNSFFKQGGKGRYLITAVRFRLKPAVRVPLPSYITLRAELERRHITQPTVADIRAAVIAVRRARLPDPAVTPTVGSFFQNPIVETATFEQLHAAHPDLPHWPAAHDRVKLAAAWLVEQCGLKGIVEDGVGLSDKQAICLINPGRRPAAAVLAFSDKVIASVKARFGVTLQLEPELIA